MQSPDEQHLKQDANDSVVPEEASWLTEVQRSSDDLKK